MDNLIGDESFPEGDQNMMSDDLVESLAKQDLQLLHQTYDIGVLCFSALMMQTSHTWRESG